MSAGTAGTAHAAVDDVVAADVVVVGAGAAGLTAALEAAPRTVTVLSVGPVGTAGATPWAQGGVAAAVGPDDDPSLHAADTLAVAGGLADPVAVHRLTREGPRRVRALIARGARFARDEAGDLALAREAGHARRRVLHAGGDATGREVVRVLAEAARRAPTVRLVEGVRAEALVRGRDGAVAGVVAVDGGGTRVRYAAAAVVLATGGLGWLYARTTNPPGACGDGLALAALAGARLVDLEFVQFHPTALAAGGDPLPLLTEALRGEGARLLDGDGAPLMHGVHPDGDLASRDVVARAAWHHLAEGGTVLLDLRMLADLPRRFPTVAAVCAARGLDPARAPVPVTPAAHYHMGGIAVDGRGRTSAPGLWACGEVASSGVHGANRLASNSLLEALVAGARVAGGLPAASGRAASPAGRAAVPATDPLAPAAPAVAEPRALAAVRDLMWRHVGLVRDADGLGAAAVWLAALAQSPDPAVRQAALVAGLVAAAAAARPESRGAHHRADHPQPDPAWQRRLSAWLTPRGPVVEPGPLLARAAA